MTRIILEKMRLTNWMGERDKTFEFSPDHTHVLGHNGVGKTRLFEAYRSTITGKFIDDSSDFRIVKDTIFPEFNKEKHSVKLFLKRDRKDLSLERIYRETYTTKPGSTEKKHTGHTTDYLKNDKPLTATEYDEYIKDIAKMDEIKMVSDPLYFNNLDWQKKREILVTMAGDIPEDEILMGMKQDLADNVRKILDAQKSLDDEKGKLANYRKMLHEELEKIDPAISEKQLEIPTETDVDFDGYESALNILRKRDEGIVEKMTTLSNDAEAEILAFYEKENQITAKRQQQNQLYLKLKAEWAAKVEESKAGLNTIEATLTNLRKEKVSLESMLAHQEKSLQSVIDYAATAREQYGELKKQEFVFDPSPYMAKKCPICGKQMDDNHHDLVAIEENALAEYNTKKADKMNALKLSVEEKAEAAKPIRELIESYKSQIADRVTGIEQAEAKKSGETATLEMPTMEQLKDELATQEDFQVLVNEIKVLEGTLGTKPEKKQNDDLKAERKEIEAEISKYTLLLGKKAEKAKILARIDELLKRQKEIGQLIAESDNSILAIDAFNDSFTNIMAERVNKLFPNVEFRMFRKQMNGGIEKICELWTRPDEEDPTGPRPWRSLNTGKKVEVGMECIKTFNKFFDLYLPIFIENREGAFKIPKMDTQVISLHAQRGQNTLLFEYE